MFSGADDPVVIKDGSSIAAIVVTHNRLALLTEAIDALRQQTRPLDQIVVVNNGSTDGTAAWLANQTDLFVITQPNSGSSGGQYAGIKSAYESGHDWFWCMDDDTIPDATALEHLVRVPYYTADDTGCLSSLVLDSDRRLFDPSYCQPSRHGEWVMSVVHDHSVRVERATFVSLMINRRAVGKVGLPLKELFIMRDDWEFTERIARHYKNYCVLDSRVVHKVKSSPDGLRDFYRPDWKYTVKYLYCVRNDVILLRLQPISTLKKTRVLVRRFLTLIGQLINRKVPLRTLAWFFSGLVMRVQIDRVRAD